LWYLRDARLEMSITFPTKDEIKGVGM
jgi:hypothetical protein